MGGDFGIGNGNDDFNNNSNINNLNNISGLGEGSTTTHKKKNAHKSSEHFEKEKKSVSHINNF